MSSSIGARWAITYKMIFEIFAWEHKHRRHSITCCTDCYTYSKQANHVSAEVIAPTCFTPFVATMFLGFCTVVIPDSSTFQISFASNVWRSITSPRFEKNNLVFSLLNAEARAKLVASGWRIEREVCRFMKPENQSSPAISFSFHDVGKRNI